MSEVLMEKDLADYDPEHPEHRRHTLYVIFHGAIAFYDDPKLPWIDAFVTDLKDDHQYLCGKFMGEGRIPRGSDLELRGVLVGEDSFGANPGKFLHFMPASIHLDGVYSRLRFPRPHRIYRCFNFSVPSHPDVAQICIAPVFQYRFFHLNALHLNQFLNYSQGCPASAALRPNTFIGWKPANTDPFPLTLHVRAEEDIQPAQPARDFIATNQILGNTNPTDITPYIDFSPGDRLPGISDGRNLWEIQLSLRQRIAWLTAVGASIQIDPPDMSQPFPVPPPLGHGDDDPSCGPFSGGSA